MEPLLRVDGLTAAYGQSQVLFGLSLTVGAGEVVTLMGRNGMGKTTTIRAILGLTPPTGGSLRFQGRELSGQPPHRIARAGVALVPEGRQVFPTLTVRENLIATAANRHKRANPWTIERVHALFPRLAERAGNLARNLSGGEQQMLAIGRALMTNPTLLILDEATEGLAPLVRAEIWDCLAQLKAEGQAILVVDKTVAALARLADRHHVIEKGRLAWSGDSAALLADPSLKERYLGV
jgi:branched-chain amino acid transport system ATP-binding protein